MKIFKAGINLAKFFVLGGWFIVLYEIFKQGPMSYWDNVHWIHYVLVVAALSFWIVGDGTLILIAARSLVSTIEKSIAEEVETKPNVGEWMGETNGND